MLEFAEFKEKYFSIMAPLEVPKVLAQKDSFAETYYFKYRLAMALPVNSFVEFGVRAGYSAWAFLLGKDAKKASYRGFDFYKYVHGGRPPEYQFKEHAEKLLAAYDYAITIADTQGLTENDLPRKADLYHVDAHHGYAEALHDLEICYHASGPQSYILVDDITYIPTVKKAVKVFLDRHPEVYQVGFSTFRGDVLLSKASVRATVDNDAFLRGKFKEFFPTK